MARILVVEDDAAIADLLRLYLSHAGHVVEICADGATGLRRIEQRASDLDLVLLDLMLPHLDGRGLCRRVRDGAGGRPDLPVIMLTALDDDRDKIEGLDLGADDYLTKPFNPDELLARVRAVLRRGEHRPSGAAPREPDPPERILGDARLNLETRRLTVAGEEIFLRAREFDLLAALAARPGVVLSREVLLDRVWNAGDRGDTRTVDVHVSRLRDKLTSVAPRVLIETVRSVGYRLTIR